MRKRILALLIVTVLTTGLIVGCGKKNTNVVDNTASEDVTTSPEDVTPEEETTASTEGTTTEAEGEVSTEDVTTNEDENVTFEEDDITTDNDDVTSNEDNSTSEGTVAPTKPATTNPTTVAPTAKPTVAPTKPATTNPTTVAPTAKPTVAPTQPTTVAPTKPAVTNPTTVAPTAKPTTAPTTAAPETSKVPSNWKKVEFYDTEREYTYNYYSNGTWIFEYTGDPLNRMDLWATQLGSSRLTITYRNRVKWAREAGLNPKGQDGLFLVKYLGNESDLELPKTVDGYDVLGIDNGFFVHSPVITSVTIPETFVFGFFDITDTYITKVVIKGTEWDPAMGCPNMRSEIGTVIYCEKVMYERLIQSDLMTDAKFKSLDGKTVFYDEHENIEKEYPEWHNPTI